jgi:hypothetical protein
MLILNLPLALLAVVVAQWSPSLQPLAWAWVGSAGFLRIIDWIGVVCSGHEFGSGHRIEAIYDRIA